MFQAQSSLSCCLSVCMYVCRIKERNVLRRMLERGLSPPRMGQLIKGVCLHRCILHTRGSRIYEYMSKKRERNILGFNTKSNFDRCWLAILFFSCSLIKQYEIVAAGISTQSFWLSLKRLNRKERRSVTLLIRTFFQKLIRLLNDIVLQSV